MESEPGAGAILETTRELSRHADFRVSVHQFNNSPNIGLILLLKLAENLANFVQTDYRVRTNIRDKERQKSWRNRNSAISRQQR